jgi:hypothetical protein
MVLWYIKMWNHSNSIPPGWMTHLVRLMTLRGDRRRPCLNEKFGQFGNKRLINAQKYLTNGTGQKQAPAFPNSWSLKYSRGVRRRA